MPCKRQFEQGDIDKLVGTLLPEGREPQVAGADKVSPAALVRALNAARRAAAQELATIGKVKVK